MLSLMSSSALKENSGGFQNACAHPQLHLDPDASERRLAVRNPPQIRTERAAVKRKQPSLVSGMGKAIKFHQHWRARE